jgi:hypothetical protein
VVLVRGSGGLQGKGLCGKRSICKALIFGSFYQEKEHRRAVWQTLYE